MVHPNNWVDTMFSPNQRIAMRKRTSYLNPFKAQVVQECPQPDALFASVAIATA